MRPILVTGGAGFIGSNFILQWLKEANSPGGTICCLAFAAILEKRRKEDSLVVEEDVGAIFN